ncbi:HAD-IIA family hydrolase [Psychromicrobium lacuslunae]|uniref:Haloacid dehalogenase n=1 Tax=Psychromicrobium lacuslunae TaxID=1618207 RepID=A0A0D4BWG5_9MICC|nr:HAD-IIA family hydrolase [Psychromicrobium lacuslunae]AJT40644.1 haloacid dehalogenase [Psychromicrobium lacuslunae]
MTQSLISGFDALLSDLDGVIYAGPEAIPGAVETLQRLRQDGLALGYITNNASRTAEQVAEHLRQLGAPANAAEVFGSAQAGAALLAEKVPRGAKVLVTGSQALAAEVESHGLQLVGSAEEQPDAVIQGFDPNLGWADLAEAAYAINAGALWVATNTDLTIPQSRGVAPGNGSLVDAVSNATGTRPSVAGKPQPTMFRLAAERLGAQRPLVVGDRLDTDILGGNRAQMATALVLTGIDSAWHALTAVSAERPNFLLGELAELGRVYPLVDRDGTGWRCRAAEASVADDRITISAPEGDLDGWRAACAAWWFEHPETEQTTAPRLNWQHG